jgi:hypothetical protein
MSPSVRAFDSTEDVFPVAAAWAQTNGVAIANESDGDRRYVSYLGAKPNTVCVFILSVAQHDGLVRIECGLANGLMPRLASLGSTPAIMPLESGGLTAVLPRRKARLLANDLLGRLGVEPIQ